MSAYAPRIVGVLFVAALSASLLAFLADPVSIDPACAFGDGKGYCAVARGEKAYEPFSRRPVVPTIARVLPGPIAPRFRAIAVTSLVLATSAAVLLADRVARELGLRDRRSRLTVAVIVGAGALAAPHACRLALSVPVLVDHGGLAVGLVWIVLMTSRDDRLNVAAVPLAGVAVCTREVWALVIIPVAVLDLVLGRRRRLATANIVVATVASAVIRLIPSLPSDYSELVAGRWLDARFGDPAAIGRTAWYLVFAVGLLPVVLFLRPPFRWLRAELSKGSGSTAVVVLVAGAVMLFSAPAGGGDFTRLAYPAGVLLLTFAAPWLVAHRTVWWAAVVLAAGTVFAWAPAHDLISTERAYNRYYFPWRRSAVGLTVAAIAITTAWLLNASEVRKSRQVVK